MEKPIGRKAHGFTDYGYIPLVSTSPKTMGFEDEPAAVMMTKLLSGGILLSSLVTRAEWGLFKKMPYRDHLVIDTLGGAMALASPWLFGFAHNRKARNAFILFGAFGLFAGLLSKPEEMVSRP